MINYSQLTHQIENILQQYYTKNESDLITKMAVDYAEKYCDTEHKVQQLIDDLKARRPIQYITGSAYFSDFELYVAEGVLIPRPETDELADLIIKKYKNHGKEQLTVLDIGTGSGCVAIALKKHIPNSTVYAIDVSEKALQIAKKNATKLRQDVIFRKLDILNSDTSELPQFDVIVSNPPYITKNDPIDIHVAKHEPHTALYVTNNDPLQFYKAIAHFYKQHSTPQGALYLELNSAYALEIQDWYLKQSMTTELKKDMQEMNRFLICRH